MAEGEATGPPQAPEPKPGGRKRMLVLVLVAVIIVAALGIGAVLLLGSSPAGPSLDHVTVTISGGATTVDPSGSVGASAVAVDSKGADETSNATFTWSASPAAAVTITHPGASSSALITGLQAGAVTLTVTATWSGSSKSGTTSLTVNTLTFDVTANNYHPTVGSPFLIIVRVAHADNSTDTSFDGIVHFTSSDVTAALPPDTLISPSDAGLRTFTNVIVNASGATSITVANASFALSGSTTVYGNHPPTASFTATPSGTNANQVNLDASASTDPDTGQTLSYLWAFGDGNTQQVTTPTTSHTYAASGTFTIALTVQDNYGASASASHAFTVHAPPFASFRVEHQAATGSAIEVLFNATASTGGDGTLVGFAWQFGDSSVLSAASPWAFHNYSMAFSGRTVVVNLTVNNTFGLTNTTSKSVIVSATALPPIAAFTFTIDNYTRTVSVDGSGSSTQTGQPIVDYNWTWGDGSPNTNTTSATASHVYGSDSTFTITLTVVDTLNLAASTSHAAVVHFLGVAPVAAFVYTKDSLSVAVNASATSDLNGNLAWLTWTWGDGSPSQTVPSSQVVLGHTYASAGLYQITLVANDSTNLKSGPATRYVSVATSTLDYTFSDFFNVPFGEWWDMRTSVYGDEPIRAYCFNQSSISDGICTPGTSNAIPHVEGYPYTDWYPQPAGSGSNSWSQKGNDPLIYAPYRFDVVGVNQTGYNTSQPVFLPVLNYGVAPTASSYLNFNLKMDYFDVATGNYVNNVLGCPLFGGGHNSDDGFMIRTQVDLTMDEKEAARIFGAPDSTSASTLNSFWSANSAPCTGGGKTFPSTLDSNVQNWYTTMGNGKYDVYSSFQFAYTPFYTNVTGTVDPSTLTTHVHIDMGAWGTDVLMSRFFYWGNTSYQADYLNSAAARGWWGMELAWFDALRYTGTLTPAGMDFHLNSGMDYHFNQLSAPGPDGHLKSASYPTDSDDVPYWTWGAWLTDYIPAFQTHVSELTRYTSPYSTIHGYVHSTPGTGTWIYGVNATYEFVPIAWAPKAGEQWHFVFPFGNVIFYNPNTSPQPSNPLSTDYAAVLTPLAYWTTFPGSSGWGGDVQVWNQTAWTWDALGSASPPSWPCACSANQYPPVPVGGIVFSPQGWAGGLGAAPQVPKAGPAVVSGSGLRLSAALSPSNVDWSTTAVASFDLLETNRYSLRV